MSEIAAGLAGFFIIHLSDIAAIKRVPAAKPLSWILGGSLLTGSIVSMVVSPTRFLLPEWMTWIGWVLFIISAFLLIYSLFINLPFQKTYVTAGVGEKLIKSGLYALVRHPGVPSFALLMLSLVLVTASIPMLIAAPIFVIADVFLVLIQDKYLFGRMFSGYDRYRHETPMLLPNRNSVRAFVRSFKNREVPEQTS